MFAQLGLGLGSKPGSLSGVTVRVRVTLVFTRPNANPVRHCPLLQSPSLQLPPYLSTPLLSTPAISAPPECHSCKAMQFREIIHKTHFGCLNVILSVFFQSYYKIISIYGCLRKLPNLIMSSLALYSGLSVLVILSLNYYLFLLAVVLTNLYKSELCNCRYSEKKLVQCLVRRVDVGLMFVKKCSLSS